MNRKSLFIIALIAIPVIVSSVMFRVYISSKNELNSLKQQQKEMQLLKGEFLSVKAIVDSAESKKSMSKVQGIVQAVDEVALSLGMKAKVKSVKASGGRDIRYAIEEDADVQVERATMNEMVNLLYKIENAPMALSLKRINIRTAFEDPTLLNISMTLSLIRNK